MPFPFSASGSINVGVHTAEELSRVVSAVESALEGAKPKRISRSARRIAFRTGIARPLHSWSQLAAISSGRLGFTLRGDRAVIRYRISFLRLVDALFSPAERSLYLRATLASR